MKSRQNHTATRRSRINYNGRFAELLDHALAEGTDQIMLQNGQQPHMRHGNVSRVLAFQETMSTDQIKDEIRFISQSKAFRRDLRFPPNVGVFWYRENQFAIDIFELPQNDAIRVYLTHMNPEVSTAEEAAKLKQALAESANLQDELDAAADNEDDSDDDIPLDSEIVDDDGRPQQRDLTDDERLILSKILDRILSEPSYTHIPTESDVEDAPFLRGLAFHQRKVIFPFSPEGDAEMETILRVIDPRT
jgi:hypothetical protein